jgi:hypothetical protein
MRYLRNAGLAVLALAVSASTAVAQAKGKWELGVDFVGLNINTPDGGSGTTTIGVGGGGSIRAGKMISDKLSIEPMLSFTSISGGGGSSFSSTSIEVAALWHLKAVSANAPGWFVRPVFSFTSNSGGGSSSSNTQFGAGFGMKKQLKSILVMRAEAYFLMTPEDAPSPSMTDMGLRGGLSIFP